MDKAIRLSAPGGVEGLQFIDWPPQSAGPGDIRLRHAAIGLNFIDIYHRTGLYPLPSPWIPGVEGAGVVEAVGDGVTGLTVGDRIVYAGAAGAMRRRGSCPPGARSGFRRMCPPNAPPPPCFAA